MILQCYRNTMTKILILSMFFSLLIINSNTAYGETFFGNNKNLSFEVLDRESGLSNLSVSSIIQDKNGFIWFGTQSGLNCYDGREMKIIRNNPFEDDGLVHNLIQTMYYDEENHEIWIGTYQGVSRYLISENEFINYTVDENGLSNPVVIAIEKDNQDNFWFGTMDGLNKLDVETGLIKKYDIEEKVVRALIVDSTGRLIIGTHSGLQFFNEATQSAELFELDLPSPYVMVVKEFEKGTLTLGLWDGGVAEVDLEMKKMNIRNYKDNRVYSLIQTDDGTQWVGTWGGGLFAVETNGDINYFSGDDGSGSLVHPVVYSMYQDDTGVLWIGTNGGGICKVNPRKSNYVKFSHDSEDSSTISQGKVNKMFQDSDNNLWFTFYNNGLNYYDNIDGKIVKIINDPEDSTSLPDNQVTDIIEQENKRLLLGTGIGLAYYDMVTKEFSAWDILPEDTMVYALAKDLGSNIWVGTYRNGVYKVNETNGEVTKYGKDGVGSNQISDNLIYAIEVDSKNRVWVATNNGLNLLEPDTDKFKTFNRIAGDYSQLASNTIRALFEDSKGRIWIGTVGGGVALYNEDGTFTSYTAKDGMSSNIVMGILEGEDGSIWVSTQSGITIINPESEELFVLTPDDGIGGWEFNPGHLRDKDGMLLFGGIHGVTSIPSKYENVNMEAPRVYITGVDALEESVDENKMIYNDSELEFAPDDSLIGFKFVALDYDSPEKTRFSYKMEGFDKEWIYSGTRDYITYSHLPPGDYELFVVAESSRNMRSEPVSLKVSVRAYWYDTKVAYVFYFLTVLLVILMIFKLREAQLISQKNSELGVINKKLEVANTNLEKLSTRDSLTGLYNRRYFDTMLNEQLHLASRSGIPMTLIMLDIDDFKYVNDNFGHVAGDGILEDISEAILSKLPRSTDFVARYGGDEFAIVLYDTDEKGSIKVAKEVKEAIANVKIREEYNSEDKGATVSMGLISITPKNNTRSNELIESADEALYDAKLQGKNKICVSNKKL